MEGVKFSLRIILNRMVVERWKRTAENTKNAALINDLDHPLRIVIPDVAERIPSTVYYVFVSGGVPISF